MEFSKEQRAYVRKNVYAFEVTDKNGASFYIDFGGNVEHTTGMTDELEKLFKEITQPDVSYVQQYYDSKEESEKHSFKFKEFDEKNWKNKK